MFILLKFLVIKCSCVIFIQSFLIDIGNAFWENVHAAICSVIITHPKRLVPYYTRIILLAYVLKAKRREIDLFSLHAN